MNHLVACYVAFSALTLAACAASPATRHHMVATYAHQHGFQPKVVDGNEEYCSTRPHGTHQCVTEATMAVYMDNTSATVPLVCSGSGC
jgi:hypothetical protein